MPEACLPNVWSPGELARAAREDLGEEPGRLQQDIGTLREWIKKSPHLQKIRKDDASLGMFLRGCKFSLERTKEKLDFHYTVRGTLPEWFSGWDTKQDKVSAIIASGCYLPLRGYDRHGRRVILMRNGAVDPKNGIEDGFKVSTMVMTTALEGDEQAEIRGIVLIQDMAGMTAAHALQMNPVVAKKAMTVWQDAYPSRPKALHFVNMPPIMESVFKMVQSLQKEKLRERNHVHPKGNMTAVIEDLGKEVLPPEYGGCGPNVGELTQYWAGRLEERREWLLEQSEFKTEEKKRPGSPRNHTDVFGIEGSFRKLDID